MRLSISGWEPIASHIICLFLGVALTNISYKPCLQETLSPNKILIPFSEKKLFKISSERTYSGQKVMLIKNHKKNNKNICLATSSFSKIRKYNGSLFSETSKRSAKEYLNLIKS